MEIVLTKESIRRISEEQKYTASNVEKVLRLLKILDDLNTLETTRGKLALKGGTAINLVAFDNLPRLSVDLDFNFAYNIGKEDMIGERKRINNFLFNYLEKNGYTIGNRNSFTLDSIILTYDSISGSKDKIKLDINYHNRCHIFEPIERTIQVPFSDNEQNIIVKSLVPIELFAGKIKAFYERCKPRDIYDVYSIAKYGITSTKENKDMLRKCVLFYGCIGNSNKLPIFNSNVQKIIDLPFKDIRAQLLPVLHIKSGKYPKDEINETVISFLADLMQPEAREIDFWNRFMLGDYRPELLFEKELADRLMNHPVALYTLTKYKEEEIIDNKVQYSNISVYPDQSGTSLFIRCKADGVQLMHERLSSSDKKRYEDVKLSGNKANIAKLIEELAEKYFKDQLENTKRCTLKR